MSPLDVPEALRRVADAAEVRALRADAARLDTLEAAIAENTALAVPLERVVTELEQTVVRLLAAEGGRGESA